MDRFEIAALLGGQRRFEEQADHGDDAVHRRADFVAHGRQKIGFGAHSRLGGEPGLGQIVVVPAQVIVPALRFQKGAQTRAKHQGFKRLAHAIAHPQVVRAQFVHRVILIGKRGDEREGCRRIFLKLAQEFKTLLI